MSKILAVASVAVALALLAMLADAQNYGSFVPVCTSRSNVVRFRNYAQQDCRGNFTIYEKELNQCKPELLIFSWNAFCNSTWIWYNNFDNSDCGGSSVLTRCYRTNKCVNCANAECKTVCPWQQ
jgi:hypothetical protein